LVRARPLQIGQHGRAPRAPVADGGDLLGQVLDPRSGGSGLDDITVVEALQIVGELGIGELDELGQGCAGKIAILVVDRYSPDGRPIRPSER